MLIAYSNVPFSATPRCNSSWWWSLRACRSAPHLGSPQQHQRSRNAVQGFGLHVRLVLMSVPCTRPLPVRMVAAAALWPAEALDFCSLVSLTPSNSPFCSTYFMHRLIYLCTCVRVCVCLRVCSSEELQMSFSMVLSIDRSVLTDSPSPFNVSTGEIAVGQWQYMCIICVTIVVLHRQPAVWKVRSSWSNYLLMQQPESFWVETYGQKWV